MPLNKGIYEIRFVPKNIHVPFIGGVYATGETINAPVRAEALNPSASGAQGWQVEVVDGKPDTYTITYPGFPSSNINLGVGPALPGFGLGEHRGNADPVLLTTTLAEWVIVEVDAQNGIYRIQEPANGLVGAVHAITEENSLLLVKSFQIIRHMLPLPQWQFVPIKN